MPRPLAIVAALCLAVVARAAAPPAQPAPGPLFNADEVHINPLHLSLAAVGATAAPGTGQLASVAAIYAGEQHHAWRLDGAMTNRYSRVSLGATTLLSATSPFGALAVLDAGQQLDCWALLDTDRYRALPADWLSQVTDNEPIGVGGIEAEVYTRVLIRAYYTSLKAFKKAARRDVTYAHIFGEPERYRGVVVRVEGRLLRVNRFDPPHEAMMAGVGDLYEAWVFNDQLGTNPYCVLFTEWPEGLPRDLLGEKKIDRVVRVAIDGYFFKKYRYKSNDARGRERDAPLVIGHGLLLLEAASDREAASAYPMKLLMGVFGGAMGAIVLFVVGVTYWYRRSDGRVRRRILARMPEFQLPQPDAPPLAAPVSARTRMPMPRRETLPTGFGRPSPGEPRSPEKKEKPPPDEDAGG